MEPAAVRTWGLLGLIAVGALALATQATAAVVALGLVSVALLGATWLLLRRQRRELPKLAAETDESEPTAAADAR